MWAAQWLPVAGFCVPSVVNDTDLAAAIAYIVLVKVVDILKQPLAFLVGAVVSPVLVPVADAVDTRHNGDGVTIQFNHSGLCQQVLEAVSASALINFLFADAVASAPVLKVLIGLHIELDDVVRADDGEAGDAMGSPQGAGVAGVIALGHIVEVIQGDAVLEQAGQDGRELEGAGFVGALHGGFLLALDVPIIHPARAFVKPYRENLTFVINSSFSDIKV